MSFAFNNLYQVSLFVGGIVALVSSITVYYDGPRKQENIGWFLSNLFAAIWSFGYLYMISTTNHDRAYASDVILHGAATFVPLFYFYFALAITNTHNRYKYFYYFFSAWAVGWLFAIPSHYFIADTFPKFVFNFAPDAGPWYIFFALYFFLLVLFAIAIIFSDIRTRNYADLLEKKRMKYILIASILGFGGGGSVFLLTFNITAPYALPLFSLYPIVVTYAILKHRLFNVRIIATELFVFAIWMFILLRILFAVGRGDQISNIILFFVTIVIGAFLIRSVWKEVTNRERIEQLAKQLEGANEKLKTLDSARAEFVSIASHQLRTPPATIKWYLAAVLAGDFGPLRPKVKDALKKAEYSNNSLISLIDDLLNVSRIERGKMEFIFESGDLTEIIKSVVMQLEPEAASKKIKVKFLKPAKKVPKIVMDKEKLKQVINNLVDNAIKYSDKGSVTVALEMTYSDVLVKVKDNGKGIKPEEMDDIFSKFKRGSGSVHHGAGLGLGLYVARVIVEHHNGQLTVESEGENKGSTFTVKLPLKSDLKKEIFDLTKAVSTN